MSTDMLVAYVAVMCAILGLRTIYTLAVVIIKSMASSGSPSSSFAVPTLVIALASQARTIVSGALAVPIGIDDSRLLRYTCRA